MFVTQKKSNELKTGRYALEPIARLFTYNVVFTTPDCLALLYHVGSRLTSFTQTNCTLDVV